MGLVTDMFCEQSPIKTSTTSGGTLAFLENCFYYVKKTSLLKTKRLLEAVAEGVNQKLKAIK